MCGRFTLSLDTAGLQAAFSGFIFPAQVAPRYNIAPSQPVLAVPNDGTNRADYLVWGLIPSWSKDPAIGARMINARAETLAEKPSFRGPYRYKRCLVFADGFYEWKKELGTNIKTPYYIHLEGKRPFALAGLWDEWLAPDGSRVKSCTLITTAANELMRDLHERMPVLLDPADYAAWLDPQPRPPASLQTLLKPYPPEAMRAYPVSRLVNQARLDRPEMIAPAQ